MSDDKASGYVSSVAVICSSEVRLEDIGTVGEPLMPQTCSHLQRALRHSAAHNEEHIAT